MVLIGRHECILDLVRLVGCLLWYGCLAGWSAGWVICSILFPWWLSLWRASCNSELLCCRHYVTLPLASILSWQHVFLSWQHVFLSCRVCAALRVRLAWATLALVLNRVGVLFKWRTIDSQAYEVWLMTVYLYIYGIFNDAFSTTLYGVEWQWLVTNGTENKRKQSLDNSRHYPGICWKDRKNHVNPQGSPFPGRYLNLGPSEYKPRVLITWARSSLYAVTRTWTVSFSILLQRCDLWPLNFMRSLHKVRETCVRPQVSSPEVCN